MKTFALAKVLDAITQPRTKAEISEETGLSAPQITDALQTLREKMQPIHTMGTKNHTHYYLPEYQRVSGRTEPMYSQLYKIMDAGDWWSGDELVDLLDCCPMTLRNYIAQMRGYGVEVESRKSAEGLRMHEYRVVVENSEDLENESI